MDRLREGRDPLERVGPEAPLQQVGRLQQAWEGALEEPRREPKDAIQGR